MQVAVIGDSIVHGGIDKDQGGWVNRLKIISEKKGRGDHVFNLGLGGNNSGMILERTDGEVKARIGHVKNIIFSTGTNDMNLEMPLLEYKKNLVAMGAIAKAYDKKVFFMGLHLRSDGDWAEKTTAYDATVQEVCREGGYTYIPTHDLIVAEHLNDGVHPNGAGHAKLAARAAEYMKD